MKKFTKISLIIAAILGGIGILFCGIASVTGGGLAMLHQMARDGELDFGNWYVHHSDTKDDYEEWNSDSKSEGTWISSDELVYEYALADIKNIDMDISVAGVSFVEGSKADAIVVKLHDCKEKFYKGGISDDTLKLKYEQENDYSSKEERIIIEIPAGKDFEKLDLEIGATDAEFSLKDVSCETLLLDVGAGNIVANDFEVKEYMEISAGVGNVEIDGGNYKNVKLECGMGNFTVKGSIAGNLVAECGVGNMELELNGDPNAYNYDLACGLGELDVNGTTYSNISGSNKVQNAGAIGTIQLECGMGSLSLVIQ